MTIDALILALLMVVALLGIANTIDTTNKRLEALDRSLWAIRDAIRARGE